ncbi:MAG: circadian clock protein KaiC [Candidatus Micrarchaeia archaeon]|jgi:circadian clock protein KaiC
MKKPANLNKKESGKKEPDEPAQASPIKAITKMPSSSTGIVEMDLRMNGGFPKGAVVLASGNAGCGKTTFALQWLFQGIKENENGLYITLTEPIFKTLLNLERYSYYDKAAVEEGKLTLLDMREYIKKEGQEKVDPDKMIDFIETQVRASNAKRLCIDSVTAVAYLLDDKATIRKFIFELGKTLSTLGCTTVLTSEVSEEFKYSAYGVEEFISDAIIYFDQAFHGIKPTRFIRIVKIRGKNYDSQDIHFTITSDGIVPVAKLDVPLNYSSTIERISTGLYELDDLFAGGVYRGSSTLLAGATGTGKTILGIEFALEGLRNGEKCLYVGYEESKDQIIRNAMSFGWNLGQYEEKGDLSFICLYPNEKTIEEHMAEIAKHIENNGIQRCIIDSVSAFYTSFPAAQVRQYVSILNGYLKTKGITSIFISLTPNLVGGISIAQARIGTITDNIIMLRFVEIDGEMRMVLNILKMRGSSHNKGLQQYAITKDGIIISHKLVGYEGILTGMTTKVTNTLEDKLAVEFKQFIGPMADTVFSDVKKKGLTRDNIIEYINKITLEGILNKDDASAFIANINSIMNAKN